MPLLETLLGDAHPFVRATACESLGALRSRASVPKLSTVLSGDADPRVPSGCRDRVRLHPETRPRQAVDGRFEGRGRARASRGDTSSREAPRRRSRQALSAALSDTDAAARKLVAASLGEIGSKGGRARSFFRLIRCRCGVRGEAAKALGSSATPAPGPPWPTPSGTPTRRARAGRDRPRQVRRPRPPVTYAALKSPDATTRQQAATAVGLVGDAKGLASLEAARAVEKDAGVKGVMDFMLAQLHARLGQPAAITAPSKKAPIKKNPAKTPAKKVTR